MVKHEGLASMNGKPTIRLGDGARYLGRILEVVESRQIDLAAVIERDGRYLVCQRRAHKRHGSLWEFPGGKVEPGESLMQAAFRELQEELGMRATEVGTPVLTVAEMVLTLSSASPTCRRRASRNS